MIMTNLINQIYRYRLQKFNKFDKTNIFFGKSQIRSTEWGKYSTCNNNCNIVATKIGNYVSIASNVIIGPRNHIFTNFTTHDFPYTKNEHIYFGGSNGDGMFEGYFNKIGHDVWIGTNSIILQGVEIGNGAIIASGSIVTKSIPPYATVGGNPAKIIGYRFTVEQIEKLEKTRWYLRDIDEVIQIKNDLSTIVEFNIENFKKKNWKTAKSLMRKI